MSSWRECAHSSRVSGRYRDADKEGGAWTPQRLKQTLIRHLHGERVVTLANREPYIHTPDDKGEFVAARDDENGVLVLSQFAGAAKELTEALVVNPYDLEEASSVLAVALNMSPDEQRDRMRAMRTFVAEYNVYRWAGRMLVDAARLRRRERITGKLTDHIVNSGSSS